MIGVALVGPVDAGVLSLIGPAVRCAFDTEVVSAPAMPLVGFHQRRKQHLSTAILDELAVARRPQWERLLGVCDEDLFVPDLNFVFGEADAARRVAVISLQRLHTADRAAFERRASTEAIHELGHTYGLSHCDNPRCVMWFSNTLAESDRKGMMFCPRHADALARVRTREAHV